MFRIEETTVTEVYAHALDEGGAVTISGNDVSYEDPHDLVTYHADRAKDAFEARRARFHKLLDTVPEAGTYFFGYISSSAVHSPTLAAEVEASLAATEAYATDRAKRDQDAAFATYEVQS